MSLILDDNSRLINVGDASELIRNLRHEVDELRKKKDPALANQEEQRQEMVRRFKQRMAVQKDTLISRVKFLANNVSELEHQPYHEALSVRENADNVSFRINEVYRDAKDVLATITALRELHEIYEELLP